MARRMSNSVVLNRRYFLQGASAAAAALCGSSAWGQANGDTEFQGLCIDGDLMVQTEMPAAAPGGALRAPAPEDVSPLRAVLKELEGGEPAEVALLTGVSGGLAAPGPNLTQEIRDQAPRLPGQDEATAPARAAYSSKWNKKVLDVFFFDKKFRDETLEIASTWSKCCGLEFREVSSVNADIRVDFRRGGGNWSLVGMSSLRQNLGRPSMNIEWTADPKYNRYLVLHEFGHAMGMIHEHQQPRRQFRFQSFVYQYFSSRGLNKPAVDFNIVKLYNENELLRFSDYDKESIMVYAIPKQCLADGDPIEQPFDLSETDKNFAAQMYGPGTDPGTEVLPSPRAEEQETAKPQATRTLTADGQRVVGTIRRAREEVLFEFTVPTDRANEVYTVGTEGTTQVQLHLYGPDDAQRAVQPPAGDWGSPDLVNQVLRDRLGAGRYVVKISHLSSLGGGSFNVYLERGRNGGHLSHR